MIRQRLDARLRSCLFNAEEEVRRHKHCFEGKPDGFRKRVSALCRAIKQAEIGLLFAWL